MIDRRLAVFGAVALTATPVHARQLSAIGWARWLGELVGAAELVVAGVMRPPVPRPTFGRPNEYAEILVESVETLKGTAPEPLVFRHTLIEPGVFNTIQPWLLAGQPALLFLGRARDGFWSLVAFEGAIPLTLDDLALVRREIALQASAGK